LVWFLKGAGDSGKSTIAKQMKIIHLKGFTKEERIPYRAIVHSNCYVAMRSVVLALCKIQAMDKLSEENKVSLKKKKEVVVLPSSFAFLLTKTPSAIR
jgi:hypothetical protein